jgi:uncharacterized protein YndB with AHSA1/START domain
MFHTQRDSRHTLKISRIIPASRKEVFEAWTTAESLKQWICPEDSSVSFIELDVRVGGTFRIEMQHADEGEMVLTGIYREIRPPEKLVFTWVSKHTHYRDSLVTLDFLAHGEATELILRQTQLPDEEAVTLHADTWAQLLEHLEDSVLKSDRSELQ